MVNETTGGDTDDSGWPDPDDVATRVAALVADQVKTLECRRLDEAGHGDRLMLLLSADAYGDFWVFCKGGDSSARAARATTLHKRFARRAMRLGPPDPDPAALADLVALARECFDARGGVNGYTRLPNCLHPDSAPGGRGI